MALFAFVVVGAVLAAGVGMAAMSPATYQNYAHGWFWIHVKSLELVHVAGALTIIMGVLLLVALVTSRGK